MRMSLTVVVLASLFVGAPSIARADLITVYRGDDVTQVTEAAFNRLTFPEGGPAGTPFTITSTPLTTLGGVYGDLADYRCFDIPIGTPRGSTNGGCFGAGHTYLEVTFDAPTSFISFSGSHNADPPALLAYNTAGELLTLCVAPWIGPYGDCLITQTPTPLGGFSATTTLVLEREQDDIARVVWGQMAAWNARIDVVSFSVPEPATLSLLTIGVLGFLAGRGRRRHC